MSIRNNIGWRGELFRRRHVLGERLDCVGDVYNKCDVGVYAVVVEVDGVAME